MIKKKDKTSEHLQTIPGIGKSMAEDLKALGIYKVSDLVQKNPQDMYDELCRQRKTKMDRCVLYVFRCAVYYAENDQHDPELLKWWNWKNSN
ncbi:MAG: helix-hairpin-helix domain-containing protein [Calditrichaceae bacterium]|nr:helix-hairpin-helix domain-containing protein [Calditrichaceae bacterium]MBN2710131.1 helix-hairpin-helix domain-containing protein [Calditrichaceae bacterium]RQV93423.1 MAG: pathogenicity locus [Calditrichota bacterium]